MIGMVFSTVEKRNAGIGSTIGEDVALGLFRCYFHKYKLLRYCATEHVLYIKRTVKVTDCDLRQRAAAIKSMVSHKWHVLNGDLGQKPCILKRMGFNAFHGIWNIRVGDVRVGKGVGTDSHCIVPEAAVPHASRSTDNRGPTGFKDLIQRMVFCKVPPFVSGYLSSNRYPV